MANPQARPTFIAKTDLHPALEFARIPIPYVEREEIRNSINMVASSPRKAAAITFAAIKTHVTQWNATGIHLFDPDPKIVDVLPLTVESIGKLNPFLVDRLYLTVLGAMPSDSVPTAASEEDRDEFAATLLKAASDGMSPGDAEEIATIKN